MLGVGHGRRSPHQNLQLVNRNLQSKQNDKQIMTKDIKKHPHTYRSNGKINAKNFGNGNGSGAAWTTYPN